MEPKIESNNAQSKNSASFESEQTDVKICSENVNRNGFGPIEHLISPRLGNSRLYFRSLSHKAPHKTSSFENTYDCVHSNEIFATNFKSLNTTQTTQPNLNSTEKTNINKNDNNEFLNSNYLSKSLSTNSTPSKLLNLKVNDTSSILNKHIYKKKSLQANSHSLISTWLHYPNIYYNSRTIIPSLSSNECSSNQTIGNRESNMTLSNPSSQIAQLDESENRRQTERPPTDQKSKSSNENVNTSNLLTVSSASSTASSTSSPPTFIQNTRLSESTPSSLASSTSPLQQSNQATPTHPIVHTDRFRIKKTLETDLINSATIVSMSMYSDHKQAKSEHQADQTEASEAAADTKSEPNADQLSKNIERRISKFTVKKVETNDLLAGKKIDDENLVLVDDAKKIQDLSQNAAANADIKINENSANTQYQDTVLTASKQAEKIGETKFGESIGAQRSNSIVERNNELSEISKETDILEDEKPIDESPDKRFLKYGTEIGHGSFKTVYKGLDTESGVPVAWCELHDRKFNRQERLRFIEEAEMLKQLQHPNIVRFYEYWEDPKVKPKRIILVTELMTSGTLKAYVQRFRTTRLRVIKNFATQILKGLAYLHSRSPPVIHRDLKCDNIFVTGQSGQVKIGDLGLATLKKASFAKSVIGTPEFMAPEMYSEQYDESIDVYAFGMCLLEMATGEYPYQECSKPFEIYKRVTKGQKPDSFSKIDNEDLKELIGWCIRLNRNHRPSVKELLNHSWFMENNGLKLEVLKDKNSKVIENADEGLITFRLKVYDKARRRGPVWPENEEIEFMFDVNNDDPEQIVKEFKEKTDKICDEDIKFLTQAIKDKIIIYRLDKIPDKNEDEVLSLTTSNTNQAGNPNEAAVSQSGLSLIENSIEKAHIFSENQKILNESLAMSNNRNEIGASLTNAQSLIKDNTTVSQSQAPVKQVQFVDQINEEQNKNNNAKEVSLKLTISDFIETAETGEVVHCVLELDNKDEIKLKFGLNTDSPQDITKRLLNIDNDVLSNDYASSLTESIQNIIQHINANKQNLNSIKNKVFNSILVPLKITNAEINDKKSTATDNLLSLQSINSNSLIALQQNLNQNQTANQAPTQNQANAGSRPQSLVNINYHNSQMNMQSQSAIQQNNQYLDPSKFLIQKQYQVSFEIQRLMNSMDGTRPINPPNQQPNVTIRPQPVAPSQTKVFQPNHSYIPNPPLQQLTNPVKIAYANDHVDSGKYHNQTLHQSLLHNALMSQFVNNQTYTSPGQQNPHISYNHNINNVSPLNLQNLQQNPGSLSAPVVGSNYSLKLSPTSIGINQTESETKPYPNVVTSHGFNLVPINDNPVQNLVQNHSQQHQSSVGIVRKSSFNSPSMNLVETAVPEHEIASISLDDPKLIQTVSIQNVLTHKIEHSNDILAQLGERIRQILNEKVLDGNQMSEYQAANIQKANPIHHNPHQQHLNDNSSSYSPSLSRRNSMDLKEKKNLPKPAESSKIPPNSEPDPSLESTQFNDNNFAFILGLLGINQLAQQNLNLNQPKSQLNTSGLNSNLNKSHKTSSQLYNSAPTNKQVINDNFSNQVDSQNKNVTSIQTSTNKVPNFEELFLRQRKEIEELLKKHQDELQKHVLESAKAQSSIQQ